MFCEPKGGWRHVEVTERRTAVDFAHQMKWLVDEAYPSAESVRVVLDNLNTHKLGSLYDAFEPLEARRIAKRLEFVSTMVEGQPSSGSKKGSTELDSAVVHSTPVHGSWLNMAEIELSVFSRSCLRQRVPDETDLRRHVHALEEERNKARASIDWRFSIQDARDRLHRLYPSRN